MLRFAIIFPLLLQFVLLSGCGRSIPTNYYTLTSEAEIGQHENLPAHTFRIAKVYIPQYLERENIVTRKQDQVALNVDSIQVWAEPLGDGIRRVLHSELAEPLLQKNLLVLPLGSEENGTYTLFVDVLRFDGVLGQQVRLAAQWSVVRGLSSQPLASGIFAAESQTASPSYTDFVQAQSELTRKLAEHIRTRLKIK